MGKADRRVDERFRRQHGVVRFSQARHDGMSRSAIQRRIASGAWVPLAPGTYRHAAAQPTWHSQVMAACLHFDGVASHRCAAVLWGLDGTRPGLVEIVVGRTRGTVFDGAKVHRSSQFASIAPVARSGVPTTPIGRTLIDLAGVVGWRRFEAAVDDALRRRLIDWPALADTYRRLGRRGRNGSAALRRLLDERFGDDRLPLSAWSRWVANLITDAGLPAPELEHRIVAPDGRFIAQVDLAYPEARVAVELQSVRFHLHRRAFESDASRFAGLAALGWVVVPVTWERYQSDPGDVVADIGRTLRSRRARRHS